MNDRWLTDDEAAFLRAMGRPVAERETLARRIRPERALKVYGVGERYRRLLLAKERRLRDSIAAIPRIGEGDQR